jgi:hypothetical protein
MASLGAFSLYAAKPEAFNESTHEQFTELANNLAYEVMALCRRPRNRLSPAGLVAPSRL